MIKYLVDGREYYDVLPLSKDSFIVFKDNDSFLFLDCETGEEALKRLLPNSYIKLIGEEKRENNVDIFRANRRRK